MYAYSVRTNLFMETKQIAERIRAGILALNRSKTKIAEDLKFTSKQNFGRFISNPPEKSLHYPSLAKYLGCDLQWLLTGNGVAPSWATPSLSRETANEISRLEILVDALTRRVSDLQAENLGLRALLLKKK
jgi:hypothetical protein